MKTEKPINVVFTLNRGMKSECKCMAVKATDGCNGCLFSRGHYQYACGYGFYEKECIAGGCEIAKCKASFRTDNNDIIYKRISK